MVDWLTPSEIERDTTVFAKLICALFGLYVWELFSTCDFEWSLVSGRRKFTWPLSEWQFKNSKSHSADDDTQTVFFFLCRYCIFFALIGLLVSLSVSKPIDCNSLYTFNSWTGNMAILSASTSLMIRTIALWERQLKVVVPLMILCLAHWAILWRGMFIVHASYDETVHACTVSSTNHVFLNVSFFTTMGFDFIILCFTVVALVFHHRSRSHLWHLLFRDGLVYFFITFIFNALPAVFNVLNLNPIMNVIATIPAATISSIAACRLVVRLQDYNKHTADVFITSDSRYSAQFSRSQIRFAGLPIKSFSRTVPRRPEVCITTDHFVLNDFSPITPTTASTLSPFTPVSPGKEESTGTFEFYKSSDPEDREDHLGS